MKSLICAVLLLAVCSGVVFGDMTTFFQKMVECSLELGGEVDIEMPNSMFCKYRHQYFKCVHEAAKECAVEDKFDFKVVEKLYDDICTEGTPYNEKMKKLSKCWIDVDMSNKKQVCIQDIINIMNNNKELKPVEFMKKIHEHSCREMPSINECYYSLCSNYCGKDSTDFLKEMHKITEPISEELCKEILSKKDN